MMSETLINSENLDVANTESPSIPKPASAIEDPDSKKLRIQTGVVSRLLKEHAFYLADAQKLLQRIEEMKV